MIKITKLLDVKLWICILEVLGSNLVRINGYPEVNSDFPQTLQLCARILPLLGHDHFLPNPSNSLFISSYHLMLYNLDRCSPNFLLANHFLIRKISKNPHILAHIDIGVWMVGTQN
jgi:hypothetical protein